MSTDYPCQFCDELNGLDNPYSQILGHLIPDRTIIETENFIVWPSLGPISRLHLMIIPKRHYYSILSMPPEIYEEFEALKTRVMLTAVDKLGDSVIAFEHGSVESCLTSGACIEHAHIHIVQSNDCYDMLEAYFNFVPLKQNQHRFSDAIIPYVYYEAVNEAAYVAVAPQSMPSQFLRKVIANNLKYVSDWNWRSSPEPDRVKENYITGRDLFGN